MELVEIYHADYGFLFHYMEDMEVLIFACLNCEKKVEVPEYVVADFQIDSKKGKEVELLCPFCGGTMRQARNVPSE
jgi:hypothetical protein